MDCIMDCLKQSDCRDDAEVREIKHMLSRYVKTIDPKKELTKKDWDKADKFLRRHPQIFFWTQKECASLQELVDEIQAEYEDRPVTYRLCKYEHATGSEREKISLFLFGMDWAVIMARDCGMAYGETIRNCLY